MSGQSDTFGFDAVVRLLKMGGKATRPGLPGQYIFCGRQLDADLLTVSVERLQLALPGLPTGAVGDVRVRIFLVNHFGKIVPNWRPTQTDVLTNEWTEVP